MKKRVRILSNRQIVGIVLLLVMIALTEVFIHTVSQRPHTDTEIADSLMLQETSNIVRPRYKKDSISIVLQRFDPNKSDSMTLLRLGLKHWQVHNLLQYRRAGGVFRKEGDMRKLYGLSDSMYHVLRPYIAIDTTLWIQGDSIRKDSTAHRYTRHKRDTIIELNSADTTSLQYIRGIGRYTATQIIRYRELLGGYNSPEQIREIEALSDIEADSLLTHLTAEADSIHPIDVNHASVKRLMRHPYLNFEQARAIYTLRRNRFRLEKWEELEKLEELSAEDIERLKPYLIFGP